MGAPLQASSKSDRRKSAYGKVPKIHVKETPKYQRVDRKAFERLYGKGSQRDIMESIHWVEKARKHESSGKGTPRKGKVAASELHRRSRRETRADRVRWYSGLVGSRHKARDRLEKRHVKRIDPRLEVTSRDRADKINRKHARLSPGQGRRILPSVWKK